MEWFERVTATEDGRRKLAQESTILNVTEVICELMEREGVSRAELARRLGWKRTRITEILKHQRNMTLRTVSDIFFALGTEVFIDEKRTHWHEDDGLSDDVATVATGD